MYTPTRRSMLNALNDGSEEEFSKLQSKDPGLADHAKAAFDNRVKESWAINDWPWREHYASLPDDDKQ